MHCKTSKCRAFSSSDIWSVEAHSHSWPFILSVTFIKIANPWFYLLSPLADKVFLTPYHIFAFLKIKKNQKTYFHILETSQNLISSLLYIWPALCKKLSKSDQPFLTYRVHKLFWPFDLMTLTFWPLTSKMGPGHSFFSW